MALKIVNLLLNIIYINSLRVLFDETNKYIAFNDHLNILCLFTVHLYRRLKRGHKDYFVYIYYNRFTFLLILTPVKFGSTAHKIVIIIVASINRIKLQTFTLQVRCIIVTYNSSNSILLIVLL